MGMVGIEVAGTKSESNCRLMQGETMTGDGQIKKTTAYVRNTHLRKQTAKNGPGGSITGSREQVGAVGDLLASRRYAVASSRYYVAVSTTQPSFAIGT